VFAGWVVASNSLTFRRRCDCESPHDPIHHGGASGYGFTNPIAPNGVDALRGAQTLPNGNTLVTEGIDGRVFEVTRDGTSVWEYIDSRFSGPKSSNAHLPGVSVTLLLDGAAAASCGRSGHRPGAA
jgi:hypothetical protein